MKIIRIDGVIGDWLNTGEDFRWRIEDLELEKDEELMIILNSPGGSVIEGFNIYNQIRSLDNPTTVKIEGFAASIASLIAMSADVIQMSEVGQFMIHRAHITLQGDKNELEKQAEILESIDSTMIQVFQAKTELSKKEIEQMLDDETWFTAAEAKKAGFIDEIVDKIDIKMAAIYINNQKEKTMNFKKLLAQLSGQETEIDEVKTEEVEEVKAEKEEVAEEEEVKTVSLDDFNELKENVKAILEVLAAKETEKPIDVAAIVKEEMQAFLKTLPASKGQPTAGATTFTQKAKHSDKYASFREMQNDIEEKTRLS